MNAKRLFSTTAAAAVAALICTGAATAQEKQTMEIEGKNYFLSGADVEVATWHRGAVGAYTIIHDDYGSASSAGIYDHMDSVLTNRGLVGCPGAITSNCEPKHWRHAEDMLRHGHEIISHSVDHSLGGNQVEMSKKIIEEKLPGYSPLFYIFPFDQWNDEEKVKLRANGYYGARSGDRQPKIDSANFAGVLPHMENDYDFPDPFELLFEPYPENNSAYKNAPGKGTDKFWFMKPFVEDAIKYNGWAIHEFHGIENMSFSIPLADYQEWMDWMKIRSDDNRIWMDGPTRIIKYRFTREYAGAPEVTANANGYELRFGTPVNADSLAKFNTDISVFFKTTGIAAHISAVQNGDTIPSKRISDNYFRVDANPMGGVVTITESAREWKKYPFMDPFDTVPSYYPEFVFGDVYDQYDTVFYKGKEWSPKWWIDNEYPDAPAGTWRMLNDVSNIRAITTRADKNGSISPLGKTLVELGTTHEITITPDAGYTVDYVNVNGVNIGSVSSVLLDNISGNNTVEVIFAEGELVYHTVTATAGANGTIAPEGAIQVAEGSSKTFTFTGNSGYAVDSVIVDGVYKGSVNSYTMSGVAADKAIRVVFKAVPTYTISATAGANGSISPAGDLIISEGADTTVTFTANAGYQIKDVIVNGVSQGAVESYRFTGVAENQTVSVEFEALPTFTVTAAAAANGTISPAGNIVVDEGETIVFTITPDAGYEIKDVTLNQISKGAMPQLTVANITEDMIVNATFVEEAGCADVQAWDVNESWTNYTVGDLRANGGKVWEVTNPGFAHYEPSGPYGHYGWKEAGDCQ